MYYRDAVAALLVYDVTDELSFRSLNFWVTGRISTTTTASIAAAASVSTTTTTLAEL